MPAATLSIRRNGSARKRKRLALIAGLGGVLAVAAGLVLVALQDQIVFFYSPTDLQQRQVAPGTTMRIGGLVKDGSWTRDGENNAFVITDGGAEVKAHYVGVLPDLFRNGQGVVAEGVLQTDGSFEATNVLAKHDENYMPKEVVEALKQNGQWQHGAPGGD